MSAITSSPQTTGAIHLFPGVGNAAKKYLYLGTGKTAPRIRTRRGWVPFFNDKGGPAISFDDISANQEAMVSIDLNDFVQDSLARVQSVPNFLGFWGLQAAGDVGTMMVTEGFAYPLVLVFDNYITHPAMRAQGMPPGIRFFASWLIGPDEHRGGAGASREINLIWQCKSVYNRKTRGFSLGDYNVSGMPAIT